MVIFRNIFAYLCLFVYFIFNISGAMAENSAWKCELVGDVLQSDQLNSSQVKEQKLFYQPCINKDGLCLQDSYVIQGDIVLVGKISAQNLASDNWCAAYIPSSYPLPKAVGWFLNINDLEPIPKERYQDIVGDWKAVDSQKSYLKSLSINLFPEEDDVVLYGQSLLRHAPEGQVGHIIDGIILMTGEDSYIAIGSTADGDPNECVLDIKQMGDKLYLNTRNSCGLTNNYNDLSDYYEK